jgi:hypothetical protein
VKLISRMRDITEGSSPVFVRARKILLEYQLIVTDDEDGVDVGLFPCLELRNQRSQTIRIETHGAWRGDRPTVIGFLWRFHTWLRGFGRAGERWFRRRRHIGYETLVARQPLSSD